MDIGEPQRLVEAPAPLDIPVDDPAEAEPDVVVVDEPEVECEPEKVPV